VTAQGKKKIIREIYTFSKKIENGEKQQLA